MIAWFSLKVAFPLFRQLSQLNRFIPLLCFLSLSLSVWRYSNHCLACCVQFKSGLNHSVPWSHSIQIIFSLFYFLFFCEQNKNCSYLSNSRADRCLVKLTNAPFLLCMHSTSLILIHKIEREREEVVQKKLQKFWNLNNSAYHLF